MSAPQDTPMRKRQPKPKYCADCGGQMLYAEAFGRVFSCCSCCSPVVDMSRVAKAAMIQQAEETPR